MEDNRREKETSIAMGDGASEENPQKDLTALEDGATENENQQKDLTVMEEEPEEQENNEEDLVDIEGESAEKKTLGLGRKSKKMQHPVPLAPIRRIMRCDDNVRVITPDAVVIFAKACELFITELSQRAWAQAELMQKKQLQHNDVCAVIQRVPEFDFLFDILPRDDKEMRD